MSKQVDKFEEVGKVIKLKKEKKSKKVKQKPLSEILSEDAQLELWNDLGVKEITVADLMMKYKDLTITESAVIDWIESFQGRVDDKELYIRLTNFISKKEIYQRMYNHPMFDEEHGIMIDIHSLNTSSEMEGVDMPMDGTYYDVTIDKKGEIRLKPIKQLKK